MGNKSSSMLQDDEIQLISSETEFTPTQIEKLYARFTSLDKEAVGSLSRDDFLRVPELAINPLCNRIVEMFFTELGDADSVTGGAEDHDRINFRQFMKVLATFRSSGSNHHHHHHPNNSATHNSNKLNGHAGGKQGVANQQQKQNGLPTISGAGSGGSMMTNNNNNIHNKNHNNNQHHRVEFTQANSVAILSQSHGHGDHLGPPHSGLSRNASSPHMYKNGLLDVLDDHNGRLNRKTSSPIYSMHDPNHPNNSHNWTPIYDDDEPKNSRKHKLYFMFRLYDVDNDNQISFDDLKCILKQMVGTYIDEEHTNKIVARAFMEVDKDGDNFINFDEFCQVFEGSDIDDKLRIKFSH